MAKRSLITKRKLADLHPHPRQSEIFDDVSEHDLKELAADLETNGIREPVEITSNGTIINGHQRVLAAKLLDWTEIDVVIRADIESQGDAAVVHYFVDCNLHRRHLDPLGIARACKVLLELHTPKTKWAHASARITLRDEIGMRLGMSGRQVDRYLLVFETPIEVQHAFSRHRIPLVLAGKVAGLRKHVQAEIALKIRAGGDPQKLVKHYIDERGPEKPHDVSRDYRSIIKQLDDIVKRFDVDARVPEHLATEGNIAVLVAAQHFIDTRLKWERDTYKPRKPNRAATALMRRMKSVGDAFGAGIDSE